MIGAGHLRAFSGLKICSFRHMWHGVSLRPFFVTLVVAALLFAPLAMRTGSAMAMAPGDHQSQMVAKGHCGEPLAKGQAGTTASKSCCVAMWTAVAIAPASSAQSLVFERVADRPSRDHFRPSYLAKLATPPPRPA